jgi:large subunit ribosomal protein L7/L12
LEVSELVSALKTKLNITEVAMPSAAAAPAGGAAPAEAAEEVEKPKEKTIFTVKLEKFEATAKAKIIREVKAIMPNMNLVEVSNASFLL